MLYNLGFTDLNTGHLISFVYVKCTDTSFNKITRNKIFCHFYYKFILQCKNLKILENNVQYL